MDNLSRQFKGISEQMRRLAGENEGLQNEVQQGQ
jgi:hypothetical protein